MLAGAFAAEMAAPVLCSITALPFALTAGMLLMKRRGTPA